MMYNLVRVNNFVSNFVHLRNNISMRYSRGRKISSNDNTVWYCSYVLWCILLYFQILLMWYIKVQYYPLFFSVFNAPVDLRTEAWIEIACVAYLANILSD